jgi:hypothetical protein
MVSGEPDSYAQGTLGPIALFAPGEVVAYLVRTSAGPSVFVFRTLAVDDPWAASVPGVQPRVRLLVHVRSALRVRAVRRLFATLAKRALRPSELSDAFYVRVSHVLGERRTDQARLRALLRRELDSQGAQGRDAAAPGRS